MPFLFFEAKLLQKDFTMEKEKQVEVGNLGPSSLGPKP
jgi:hypothetical protein